MTEKLKSTDCGRGFSVERIGENFLYRSAWICHGCKGFVEGPASFPQHCLEEVCEDAGAFHRTFEIAFSFIAHDAPDFAGD